MEGNGIDFYYIRKFMRKGDFRVCCIQPYLKFHSKNHPVPRKQLKIIV
jgi:hypothetical protein